MQINKTLKAAPKTIAGGAQTVVQRASGRRRSRKRFAVSGTQAARAAAVGGAGVAAAVVLGARRRRKAIVGRAVGAFSRGTSPGDLNDPTLARKVESEIFRAEDAPKGSVDVNAENGVIYLRGEVDTQDDIDSLGDAARKVSGVKEVTNLLHLPGAEAKTKK
jgi:hypothetical protein